MKFKIYRGTKEISGSCVEVWADNAIILPDYVMPLVEQGILPNIKGLYDCSKNLIDGVIRVCL